MNVKTYVSARMEEDVVTLVPTQDAIGNLVVIVLNKMSAKR